MRQHFLLYVVVLVLLFVEWTVSKPGKGKGKALGPLKKQKDNWLPGNGNKDRQFDSIDEESVNYNCSSDEVLFCRTCKNEVDCYFKQCNMPDPVCGLQTKLTGKSKKIQMRRDCVKSTSCDNKHGCTASVEPEDYLCHTPLQSDKGDKSAKSAKSNKSDKSNKSKSEKSEESSSSESSSSSEESSSSESSSSSEESSSSESSSSSEESSSEEDDDGSGLIDIENELIVQIVK